MNASLILLGTTLLFAFFAVTLGYDLMMFNYQYWICWDACVFDMFEDCEEICSDVRQENLAELTREERREKSQRLKEMYGPILSKYTSTVIADGPFSTGHGHGYLHPENLEDNLEADFDYSDGFFRHFQELEIISPLSDSDDAGTVRVLKEMLFPEMWVFLAFVFGAGGFVGYRIRK